MLARAPGSHDPRLFSQLPHGHIAVDFDQSVRDALLEDRGHSRSSMLQLGHTDGATDMIDDDVIEAISEWWPTAFFFSIAPPTANGVV